MRPPLLRLFTICTTLSLLAACQPAAPQAGLSGDAPAPSASSTSPTAQTTEMLLPTEEVETVIPATSTPIPMAGLEPASSNAPEPTAAPMPTAAPPAVCSPLEGFTLAELPGIISDPYHPPPPGREERHQGVDFAYYRKHERASTAGNPVQAVLPGVAAMALAESFPYGNVVMIETPGEELPAGLAEALGVGPGESVYSLYAHLADPPEVALGDGVAGCQALGQVGKSGNAGTPHLHLETRIGKAGERFTGMAYYTLAATPELRAAYLRWRISGNFRHFDPMRLLEGEDGGDSGLP